MKKLFLLIPFFFILLSCQPILKKIYGIKEPDIETKENIIKKALKYGMDSSNIVTVNSKDFLYELNGKSIPDAAIYDRNGKYIEYRQTDTSCNAGLFQFIPSLNLTDKYNQPEKPNLETELKKFRDFYGNSIKKPEQADFYLLLYWTVWTGKLNKDHVKIWEDLARENKNCSIKIIKVNMDMQEYWDDKEKSEIKKLLKKNKK